MSRHRWTAADMPDQRGRIAVVTGAGSGIGLETARLLAGRGASVVLAVRDVDKGARARTDILRGLPDAQVMVQRMDLASLDSVRAAAGELRAAHPRFDLLVNNAGSCAPTSRPPQTGWSCTSAPTTSVTSP